MTIRRGCEHCGDPGHGQPTLTDGGSLDYSVSHSGGWIVMPAPSGYAAALASTVELDGVRLCRPHWA